MYTDTTFPVVLRQIMKLNPPYYFIQSFRDAIIEHVLPTNTAWLMMLFWIVASLGLGSIVSSKLHSEVKDLL